MSGEASAPAAGAPAGLEIRLGLPEEHRSAAAELFFEAFREKLGPILRTEEKAISAFAADENLQYAIAALQDGSLVGVCSLSYAGGEFFDLTLSTFVREFGPVRGVLKLSVLAILFRERPSKGELLVDGIVCPLRAPRTGYRYSSPRRGLLTCARRRTEDCDSGGRKHELECSETLRTHGLRARADREDAVSEAFHGFLLGHKDGEARHLIRDQAKAPWAI